MAHGVVGPIAVGEFLDCAGGVLDIASVGLRLVQRPDMLDASYRYLVKHLVGSLAAPVHTAQQLLPRQTGLRRCRFRPSALAKIEAMQGPFSDSMLRPSVDKPPPP